MFRKPANIFAVYCIIAGVFLITAPRVDALTMRTNNHITVAAGEVISDSLFATGQTVVIDGTVVGDLYCGAQTLTIRGRIQGDILCGVQSATIAGTVSGDLRIAAQTVDINGTVARNASIMAQTVQVDSTGAIEGELLVLAQRLDQAGLVGGNLQAGVQEARLAGQVGKDVELTLERLEVAQSASIAGNLTYTSEASASVANEQVVAGTITRKDPPKQPDKERWQAARQRWQPARLILSVVIYGLSALAFMRWFPRYTKTALTIMEKQPVLSLVWGVVAFLLIPIMGILLILTLVGIPLAFLLGVAVVLVVFLGRVVTVLFFGQKLVELLLPKTDNLPATVLLGTAGLWLLFSLPVIGGIASILVLLWSTGALLRTFATGRTVSLTSAPERVAVKVTSGRKARK